MSGFRVLAATVLFAAVAFADDIVLPDGKAKTTIENTCTECHGLDPVVSNPMTTEEWRSTVNRMVRKGATLSPAEVDNVVEYLSVYFAPDKIDINKASAKEIQSALLVTPAEAAAIVKYRDANGAFKDLAGLAKVDGVDQKKIEKRKDLIAF